MPALLNTIAEDLTELETFVLDFLAHKVRPGYCPSREELSRAADLGGRGYRITKLLESLSDKDYIALSPGRSRAISVIKRPDGRPFSFDTVWVPVVGLIVASQPLPSADEFDNADFGEPVELARSMVGRHQEVFALRVDGDSMIDALVHDGDLVILAVDPDFRDGDMVAARVHDDDGIASTTLKRYFRENGHVRLQPAHPKMEPLYYQPNQVTVQGKVVMVMRQLH
jgi:repressor LexA